MPRLTSSRSSRSSAGAPASVLILKKLIGGGRKVKGECGDRPDAREKFCRLKTCPTLRPELTSRHSGIFTNPREKQAPNAQPKFQTPRPEGRLRPDDARTLRRHRLRAARRPGRPRRQAEEEDAEPARRQAADYDFPARRQVG